MLGAKYLIYIKMALSGMAAVKQAIAEAKEDGEISAEEKFAIVMAFFIGIFSTMIDTQPEGDK